LLFLFGEISFGTGQPARDHVKSGSVAIAGSDLIDCFSRKIQLSKAQGC